MLDNGGKAVHDPGVRIPLGEQDTMEQEFVFDLGPVRIVASVAGWAHSKQHLILNGFDALILGIERVHMRGMQVHDMVWFSVLVQLEGPICFATEHAMPAVAFLA